MKENIYKITYKNGKTFETKAMSMALENGKVYQLQKHYPFDNCVPSVFDGSLIESIECIERNNDIED